MIDRQRIIIMSKLAVYDKRQGQADRRVNRLFRRDYIYGRNMWTRLYASIVVLIGLACYWLNDFLDVGLNLFELDYRAMLTQALMALGVTLLFFTVVGTMRATAEYQSVQARLSRYYKLLNHLDRIKSKGLEEASDNGASVSDTRTRR